MVIKVEFDNELELKFRETAMKKYGFFKGAIRKASQEAIEKWVREESRVLPDSYNPLSRIKGIMKNLRGKYTSVELQHEAIKIWTKN